MCLDRALLSLLGQVIHRALAESADLLLIMVFLLPSSADFLLHTLKF